ncbi:MAG: DUF3467 domain-containing protein [Rikenellaceae bacterium]
MSKIDEKGFANANSNIEIDLNEKIAQGRYANLAIISHSPTEFVFDFAAFLPGMQKPRVNNRVLLTPEHAKRLYISLKDNIERYEKNLGTIDITHIQKPQKSSPDNINNPIIGEA